MTMLTMFASNLCIRSLRPRRSVRMAMAHEVMFYAIVQKEYVLHHHVLSIPVLQSLLLTLTRFLSFAGASVLTRQWRRRSRACRGIMSHLICCTSALRTPLGLLRAPSPLLLTCVCHCCHLQDRAAAAPAVHGPRARGEDQVQRGRPAGDGQLRRGRLGLRGARVPRLRRVLVDPVRGQRRLRLGPDAPALHPGRRVLPHGRAQGAARGCGRVQHVRHHHLRRGDGQACAHHHRRGA
jgi:hypothetical protein